MSPMQPRFPLRRGRMLPLAAALASLVLASPAAQTKTNAPPKPASPPPATNAAPSELKIPSSTFVIPSKPQQGRDPFFPQSTRLFEEALTTAATNQPGIVAADLQLKALSGLPGHRLAMINNLTFEVGEEGEVSTSNGRARVRCLAIRDDSVLIQVNGEQRVLRFRSGL
ncbi:MAG: hypothetical protein WCL11_20200 [Verrucomicrobiota bacterium]